MYSSIDSRNRRHAAHASYV